MTRQLLLRTGLELFEKKGYAATTVDDIAAGAETTRTTFYAHFPSKSHLMQCLLVEVNEILTSPDNPPLSKVVELGDRELLKAWLGRKFDQWPAIRPYVLAGTEASAGDPEIQTAMDQWFDEVAAEMQTGLDAAGRFDPDTRRSRCVLAFGQLQFLSVRWMLHGWKVDRNKTLDLLTDSWYHLLVE